MDRIQLDDVVLVLQRLRQVPVVERGERLDSRAEQLVDEAVRSRAPSAVFDLDQG